MRFRDDLDAIITLLRSVAEQTQALGSSGRPGVQPLIYDQRVLEHQLQLLANELADLDGRDDRDHDDWAHKLRQQRDRVQAHVDTVTCRLVE